MNWAEIFTWGWSLSWIVSILTIPSVLVKRAGQPLSALSWLFALFALPPVTLIFWWIFGRTHLGLKRRRKIKRDKEFTKLVKKTLSKHPSPHKPHPTLTFLERIPMVFKDQIFPPSAGNAATLLIDATTAYPAFYDAIGAAQHDINVLFYIWQADEVGIKMRDLLTERAQAGIKVRVLYDSLGSSALPRRFFKPLIEAGGNVSSFLPLRLLTGVPTLNFRNHRKILTVDGQVGFIGGINIGEEYLRWHDMAIRIRGAALDQLQEVFAQDWFFATHENLSGQTYFGRWLSDLDDKDTHWKDEQCHDVSCATIASGPTQKFNATNEAFFATINQCHSRIWLMTPYFVPDATLLAALRSARYRGIDVRLMVPSKSDVPVVRWASRAYYKALLSVGIRVYEYDGMLHAKASIFDEDLIFLGSANLDVRSFRYNFEASMFIHSPELNTTLTSLYESHMKTRTVEITLDTLKRSSYLSRVLDSLAHLASPLL